LSFVYRGIGLMIDKDETIQELTSRVGALDLALREALDRLAALYGADARREIETLRDDLVTRWKNSGIPANRELDHAKVNRPAIDATELAFNAILAKLG
jgi:hypothetical protein